MARAVHTALADDGHLFVEAGTGTGKTFAYLVPAVLSGKTVVVSTATHALQEQIFEKDVPFKPGLNTRDRSLSYLGAVMKASSSASPS